MSLRWKLILNSYLKSSDKNKIIIGDKEYFITDKLRKKLNLRKIVISIYILIFLLGYRSLIRSDIKWIKENLKLVSILFTILSISLVPLISSLIISKDMDNEISLK